MKGWKTQTTVSRMGSKSSYEDLEALTEYLGFRLRNGSVALVLGAGASMGFGLPGWRELVNRMFELVDAERPLELSDDELASEWLLFETLGGDRMRFAELVRDALYEKARERAALEFGELRRADLLAAVGALAMASSRGSVGKIVTFNFDDVVERYLSFFGYDVAVDVELPSWRRRADVHVLHPHGLLPSERAEVIPRALVFTRGDYDAVVGQASDLWRAAMLDVMRSHVCIFVGLSGQDTNLTSLLADVNGLHACHGAGELYWGVAFDLEEIARARRVLWETRGVYYHAVSRYEDIPGILFDVCQRAAQAHQRACEE